MLTEDKKRVAYRALQDRILNGEGRASPEQRARAFSNAGLSPPLDELLGKVATRPCRASSKSCVSANGSAVRTARFSAAVNGEASLGVGAGAAIARGSYRSAPPGVDLAKSIAGGLHA